MIIELYLIGKEKINNYLDHLNELKQRDQNFSKMINNYVESVRDESSGDVHVFSVGDNLINKLREIKQR